MESKKDLWLRLRNYHFDHLVAPHLLDRVQAAFGGPDAFTRAFADKLARKLKWTTPFALRAIDEYRKFIYLGLVADFPVTPPKVIDQVWHEHLLFSRAYREFCASVLRREFDHNPELVPLEEQTAAFRAQYTATRELYRAEFDREPPAQFWGVAKFADQDDSAVAQRLRRKRDGDSSVALYDDAPLYAQFASTSEAGSPTDMSMPEFGGGDSGGGGGGGAWSDSTSHGSQGDSGSAGHGDSGGSSDSGSGCSSGCGGD